jgi:hypothetical protein
LDRHFIANIQCALFDFPGDNCTALGDAEDIFNSHAKEWISGHWVSPFPGYRKA